MVKENAFHPFHISVGKGMNLVPERFWADGTHRREEEEGQGKKQWSVISGQWLVENGGRAEVRGKMPRLRRSIRFHRFKMA